MALGICIAQPCRHLLHSAAGLVEIGFHMAALRLHCLAQLFRECFLPLPLTSHDYGIEVYGGVTRSAAAEGVVVAAGSFALARLTAMVASESMQRMEIDRGFKWPESGGDVLSVERAIMPL